jgi:hypothetical protein
LLQTIFPLFRGERETLRNVVNLPGDVSENFLRPADCMLKDANAHEAALVDVRIHSPGGDKVDDGYGLAFLPVTVDPSYPLFDAHGVPWQVIGV